MGPEMPRVSKEGKLRADRRGPDPHRGPGPRAPVRTTLTMQGSGTATCPGGAGSCASLPQGDSPTHRIQCGGQGVLCRRGTRDSLCQASLSTAYYQGAQCSRLCRTRAEPACSIKWIRQRSTFPSCRLRRKLHHPLKQCGGRCH